MPAAHAPKHEANRLAKLRSLGILDTVNDERFDRITRLASFITGLPISAISLIDQNRQFFKSIVGLDVRETPREQAFCAYTILSDDALVIPDATRDDRVSDNPLVLGQPGIRFYAGAPISADGERVGSLCVIDTKPGNISPEQLRCLRDLAQIASNELTLDLLRAEAEASERAKSVFLANMSHEIRTPISAVLGYTELLTEPVLSESDRNQALVGIERNGRHLLQLVNTVLDLSKIEAGKMQIEHIPVDLSELIHTTVDMLRHAAELEACELQLDFSLSCSGLVLTDPTRLRQIIINLLSNAIKFSSGKPVIIRVRSEQAPSHHIQTSIEVIDHGIGMSPELIGNLFQPFQQADPSLSRRFGGTGLGLTIAKHLSELLGGTIRVESEPGQGSRFTLNLEFEPAETNSTPRATGMNVRNEVSALEGLRLLLAEDSRDNQVLLAHFLTSAGAEVVVAADGLEAIDAVLGDHATAFDGILMDMQMPVIDGCEATRRLRAAGCTVPIMALTANTHSDSERAFHRAGCTMYAVKPIGRAALVRAVLEMIGRRQTERPAA